jgi:hypothetical protein
MLIFGRDQLGPRLLVARPEAASGPGARFTTVEGPFLVVPASLQPPDFAERR